MEKLMSTEDTTLALVAVDGPDAGQSYPLGRQTHIGRTSGNHIPLNDELASRRHALIEHQVAGYILSDLGSRNGTFVNGARVDRPTWIKKGDSIRIGQTTLRVAVSEAARPVPEAPKPVSMPAASPLDLAEASCPQCGHLLPPGVKFCIKCGAAVDGQAAPAAPAAHEPAPSQGPASAQAPVPVQGPAESVVGIVPAIERRKGLFRTESYNLVLTLQHLVFARLTSEMQRAAADQAKQEAKAQGKGIFGQWGATMGSGGAIVERYYQMPVEAILREHPDNFVIPVDQVRKVTFSRGDIEVSKSDRMVIHAGEKIKLDLKGSSIGEAKKVLRQVLGQRVE
jgi:pSer/pThr/pTyr-binding forkhead associated (FHA) protein